MQFVLTFIPEKLNFQLMKAQFIHQTVFGEEN